MDSLEFASSVISAVSWPLVVLLLVVILRKGLVKVLMSGPLKALKAGPGGFELEHFDKTLDDAKSEVGLRVEEEARRRWSWSKSARKNKQVAVDDFMDEMTKLAEVSPSAAILESFARLEGVLRDVVEPAIREPKGPRHLVARELVKIAAQMEILDSSQVNAFMDINTLRNVLSHRNNRESVDFGRAVEYCEVVDKLINTLEERRPGPPS